MKSIIITLCTLFTYINIWAQTIATQSSLQSVTVYVNAAELNHTAKATVPAGNSEIVIKNISSTVDENSIQIGCNTDLTIMSVSFRKEFIEAKPKSSAVLRLEDSLKLVQKDIAYLNQQISIHQQALSVLEANKIVRGENNGLQVAELQKLMDYYILKQKEFTAIINSLTEKQVKHNENIAKIQRQLAELNALGVNDSKGEIVLQVLNTAAAQSVFTISYLTYTAAWSPNYDLKTKDTKSNLRILYKGNIVQNTGLDWNKVKLSLSTGNPSTNGTAPILSTWFLNYYQPQYANSYGQKSKAMMNNIQSLDAAAPMVAGDATSVDGFTTIQETALNTVFDIDLAYDIPSDNKAHSVTMKEYEVPVAYKYYAVPKMEKDVFLLAEVADWESLNLVAGPANIIFDGTYIGKGYIDPASTQDTLNLSLGRDKKIIVKREKLQDYCSAKLIGTNKQHTVTYEIKVKNTRKESIGLLLKDQYPISTNKDIEVTLQESTDAAVNTETGVLTWKLDVAPGETKKVRISYTVKFPKDKNVGPLYK
jgi:uncharacterized protein (TIGR02231 family)